MDVAALHAWDLTPREAIRLQAELSARALIASARPSTPQDGRRVPASRGVAS
jgi:hypothetical protein